MSYFSLFQSPHPVRGATGSRSCWPPSQCHFNPRTPRGVRLAPHAGGGAAILISIHAPRVGCDDSSHQLGVVDIISIHAPREGCDRLPLQAVPCCWYFNPRTPRGVRLLSGSLAVCGQVFQSTHPARGATLVHPRGVPDRPISIHAPREGCDRGGKSSLGPLWDFNPRTPRGVRLGVR